MGDLLFSVTASDCRWDYFRGSGKGGQKRNKTSSGVRCTHLSSGAVGVSDATRSQHQNKRIAFEQMANTDRFKAWHKMETARRLGKAQQVEDAVNEAMRPVHLRVEGRDDAGQWVAI